MDKKIIYILSLVAIIATIFFFCGMCHQRERTNVPTNDTITVCDTIYQTEIDTITITNWKPKTIEKICFDTIILPGDTIGVPIYTYNFDTIVDSCRLDMNIEGCKVNVKDVCIEYPKNIETITVTNTIFREKKRNWFKEHCKFGVGVGGGYGVIHKQFDIGVGAGFGIVF